MKVINQPWGLGDVIFSMSAIRSLNDKILWPVMPHYVEGLNKAYPDITFIDWKLVNINFERKDRYTLGDLDIIPLRFHDIPIKDCMRNKYVFFGLDWHCWKDKGQYQRDHAKELELFGRLGISPDEEYNLISENFQADFQGAKRIVLNNGLKNVYVKQIPGFSLFEWSGVMENATNIHAVSSSNIYLFEMLPLKAREIKLYLRSPKETTHENYDYILQRHKYILE